MQGARDQTYGPESGERLHLPSPALVPPGLVSQLSDPGAVGLPRAGRTGTQAPEAGGGALAPSWLLWLPAGLSASPAAAVATWAGRLSQRPGLPEGRGSELPPLSFLTGRAVLEPQSCEGLKEAPLWASRWHLAVVWPLFPVEEARLQLAGNQGNASPSYLLLPCPSRDQPLPCRPCPAAHLARLGFSFSVLTLGWRLPGPGVERSQENSRGDPGEGQHCGKWLRPL